MRRLADLDEAERAGQLLWVGFTGVGVDPPLLDFIRQVRPGGFILFSRNIESAAQLRRLTDSLHRASPVPPFIALDQEGGRVSRLRPLLGPTPAGGDLADRPDAPGAVQRHAAATARALRILGFNVNFAPVLDLSDRDPANGIGDRAFGRDPALVSRLALIHVRSHLGAGIIPVGKHFPGLGSARADTHLSLPEIDRSRRLLWREDLLPYRRLRAALPMVMVGHAHYPALQGPRPAPATLSRAVVHDLLRDRLAFRGLILTDDLEMGAVDQSADGGNLALAALRAGNDGLMFCRSEERIRQASEALRHVLRGGAREKRPVEAALRRILAVKRRYLARRRASDAASALRIVRAAFAALTPASVEPGFDPTARP